MIGKLVLVVASGRDPVSLRQQSMESGPKTALLVRCQQITVPCIADNALGYVVNKIRGGKTRDKETIKCW